MNAREIYEGSNGEATTALYECLGNLGAAGLIARDLFRAQKCSERAKEYSRRYKSEAYARKQWSLGLLANTLLDTRGVSGITWGWKRDPKPPLGFPWVLYIDLPDGQCSFHMPIKGDGPEYPGEWNNTMSSADVIIAFVQRVLNSVEVLETFDATVPTLMPHVIDEVRKMTAADFERLAAKPPSSHVTVISTEPEDDYQAKLAAWKRKHGVK